MKDGINLNQYFSNNENLGSELRTIKYEYEDYSLSFLSDLGVFSKDHVDFGSKLLLETYLENKKNINNILDVGCGYGFIGITLSKILNVPFTGVDVNNRCIHLCEKNIKNNKVDGKVLISNAYENITDKYDLIITNPPIRAGKKVYYDIIMNARNYLSENGELWLVMRKDQGANSAIKDMEKYYKTTLVTKSKGFFIILAKNN